MCQKGKKMAKNNWEILLLLKCITHFHPWCYSGCSLVWETCHKLVLVNFWYVCINHVREHARIWHQYMTSRRIFFVFTKTRSVKKVFQLKSMDENYDCQPLWPIRCIRKLVSPNNSLDLRHLQGVHKQTEVGICLKLYWSLPFLIFWPSLVWYLIIFGHLDIADWAIQ